MNKAVNTPAVKAESVAAPKVEKVVEPVPPAPVATEAPAAAVVPKKIDLSKQSIKDAIAKGKALIKDGKSKADAAMEIFVALKDEEKDVVIAAFVQGATLTEKGAVTYWYNCRRKAKKTAKPE
jgi:hypothetical protein